MATTFKKIGVSAGKTIIQFPNGEERRVTPEELSELQGGKSVKKLDDDKRVAALTAENQALGNAKAQLETDVALLTDQNAALKKAAEQWQVRAEDAEKDATAQKSRADAAEATVAELQAHVKSLEAKATVEPPKQEDGTGAPPAEAVVKPKKGKK